MANDPPTLSDFSRLEDKVDKVAASIETLIRLEERQHTHDVRLGQLDERADAVERQSRTTDRKLDQWVNRGIGVWAIAVLLWTMYVALPKK